MGLGERAGRMQGGKQGWVHGREQVGGPQLLWRPLQNKSCMCLGPRLMD